MTELRDLDAHGVIAVTVQQLPTMGWMASQQAATDILEALDAAGYEVRRRPVIGIERGWR